VVTVFLLASKRSEGDLVVPGSSAGYLWLLGGLVLGIGCVAVPYPVASRRPLEPSATPEEGR
jgi:hypothetical protein